VVYVGLVLVLGFLTGATFVPDPATVIG
jgi:hypothetical protein